MGSIYIKSKMDLNKIIESTIRQFLNEDINVKDLVLYHGTKKDFNEFDLRYFEDNTSIEKEMLDLGYDGLVIKGREMVNYKPKDILYFENEDQLKMYYEDNF